MKKKQNSEQLKILIEYQKEYIKNMNNKMMLGMYIHQLKNYNNFISVLQVIIKDNIKIIKENQKIIQESLKKWSKNQIKLKTWSYLNEIDNKKILKIKKIQQQTLYDNCIQLKILKQG